MADHGLRRTLAEAGAPREHSHDRHAAAASRIWRLIEPIHAVTYFAPESREALSEAGCKGFWMGYFASRAAPLGSVGVSVVEAVFYNFHPDRVRRALPAAWDFTSPQTALEARLAGAVAALGRVGIEPSAQVETAVDLLERCIVEAPIGGRPLAAAQASAPRPGNPVGRLWQASTTLREHRGDGHVAALLTHGVGGRESHVLLATAQGFEPSTYEATRDFTPQEWEACQHALRDRGLLTAHLTLSQEGRDLVDRIAQLTDDLAAPAYASLSDDEIADLQETLQPLAQAIVRAGDIPTASPMGLDLSDLA